MATLSEARKEVAFSYAHKLILLLAAWGGFLGLQLLGEQKDDFSTKQEKRWALTDAAAKTVHTSVPCAEPAFLKQGFATRAELVATLQEKAESCERKKLDDEVKRIRARITKIEEKESPSQEDLEAYERLLDALEKREAYTRAKVIAERQHLGAVLRHEPLEDRWSKDSTLAYTLRSTFDEGSSTHVIYQVLWYGLLLFALAASTLLVVVFLTALPITDGRGYWTQRISDFLDRIPGTAGRTVAAPLLAATLGAGAFAGAMAETRPGGQARPVDDRRVYITDSSIGPQLTSDFEQGDLNVEEGDWIYIDQRKPPAQPKAIEWEKLTAPLGRIEMQARLQVAQTRRQTLQMTLAANSVNSKIGIVARAAQNAERRLQELENDVYTLKRTSVIVQDLLTDLTPVIKRIEEADRNVFYHAKASLEFADGVESRQEEQAATSRSSLSQSAEVDGRSYLKRSFYPTVYKVGPLVPKIMESRLGNGRERDAFVAALESMQGEPAMWRKKFRTTLRNRLLVSFEEPQADALLQDHFRSLRRICALPRR